MKAFVFPGQGSQKKGMGESLFDEFKELTSKSDDILGYSIKELCLNDNNEQLNNTKFTQPALFIINALSYLKKINDENIKPDYLAGHSLGEYNALFASGCMDFETGLKLVKKRGELMSKVTGGGMAAVIGLSEEKIDDIIKNNSLKNIEVANYNSTFQIVISGLKDEVEKSEEIFSSAGAKAFILLKSSGAFHSSYMESSKKEFEIYLNDFNFDTLKIPVISNVLARPYNDKDIKKLLTDQMVLSVKWTETIRYLMGKGVDDFNEIGPGNVLTGLINKIKTESEPLIIDEISEQEEIENTNLNNSINLHRYEKYIDQPMLDIAYEEVDKEKLKNIKTKTTFEIFKQQNKKEKSKEVVNEKNKLINFTAHNLGSKEFKEDYNIKYSYLTGGMYRGIASVELVIKMAKKGLLGFFGTGGLSYEQIENAISHIQSNISKDDAYGMNLLYNPTNPDFEKKIIDLFLKYGVTNIEAAAYFNPTLPLVKFKAKGLIKNSDGLIITKNKIIGKISRPEVAETLLSPASDKIITKLLEGNEITEEQAEMLKEIPVVNDLCVEADSAGHTDQGVAYVLMPAIINLRNRMAEKYNYKSKIRIGAAGGIGTPEAAAAAFILGADFIVTGSINQCTVEAKTSNDVKDLLETINVQDTEYAPAGDMFELGAKVQVLKKSVFFPARANKLYDLYRFYNSLTEIDENEKKRIQEKWFKKSFEEIFNECKLFYKDDEIKKAENNPKQKMGMVFKWYFYYSTGLALSGDKENKVDYQVHCGPALGAFNQWVRGTDLENWKNRHVDEIAEKLMNETAYLLNKRLADMLHNNINDNNQTNN